MSGSHVSLQSMNVIMTMHHGKIRGTRQTVSLGARLSSFVEVLGHQVQFERDHDISKHVSYLFISKKGLCRLRNTSKGF